MESTTRYHNSIFKIYNFFHIKTVYAELLIWKMLYYAYFGKHMERGICENMNINPYSKT
jgi:hypothetical protein